MIRSALHDLPSSTPIFRLRSIHTAFVALAALSAIGSAQTAYVGHTVGGPFYSPYGGAVDTSGNFYFADQLSQSVLEIPAGCLSDSCVLTLGGSSSFSYPSGVAVDSSGNVYVADTNDGLMKEIPAGCSSDGCVVTLGDGTFYSALYGVAVDSSGDVYFSDVNTGTVYEMSPGCTTSACIVTLGAGSGGFSQPTGLAVDGAGNVYVADDGAAEIYVMTPNCTTSACVSIIGGNATFIQPFSVALDTLGNVYVADYIAGQVYEMPPGCPDSSCVTPVGGGYYGPTGLAVDTNSNVYVSDYLASAVREVIRHGADAGSVAVNTSPASFTVTFTFSSNGSNVGAPAVLTQGAKTGFDFTDAGTGTCDTNGPGHSYTTGDTCTVDVAFSPAYAGPRYGAVVLNDSSGVPIATGYVYGTGTGPEVVFSPFMTIPLGGGFAQPNEVALDGGGNVYIADSVGNAVDEVPVGCTSSSCVIPLGGGFNGPYGVAVDGAGNIYVADSSDDAVKEMPPGCSSSVCVTSVGGGFHFPTYLALDGSGNVYVSDTFNQAVKKMPAGCASAGCVITLGGAFSEPEGLAVDGSGNVYVADTGAATVNEMPARCFSSACVTTLGGGFGAPVSIAVDASGGVYVGDFTAAKVKEMPAGCASSACVIAGGFAVPYGMAIDGSGNVYVGGYGIGVLQVRRATQPSLNFAPTLVGSSSADSPQTATVQNIGNADLNILSVAYAPDFPEDASGTGTDCSSSIALAPGLSCTLTIDFSPLATSVTGGTTPLTELVSLTDNNLNGSNATQSATVNGTALTLPALTSPNPNSTLSGASVTFTWDAGSATMFKFWLGTAPGKNNVYASGPTSSTSVTANNLPTGGVTLFARLNYFLNGSWSYLDYTYTEAGSPVPPFMKTPAPNSTLSNTASQTFTWDPGEGATMFQLQVGTTGVGSNDVYKSGWISTTSATVANMPTHGVPVYVSLFYRVNGVWSAISYTYTEGGSPTPPSMTSPTPGSALSGSSQTFTWDPGAGASLFQLQAGTRFGGSDIYKSGWISTTSATVTSIPTSGLNVYVTLFYRINGVWSSIGYVYVESGSPTAPSMISPTQNSTLGGSAQTFTWDPGTAATSFILRAGTTRGANDIYDSGITKGTSANVINIPTTGGKLYVRLWYNVGGTWSFIDYLYTQP